MSTPSNFQDIPNPDTTVAGRNHTESGSAGSLKKQAKNWQPRGCKEIPVATLARFAVRLIDRVTGEAYSADELLSAEVILPALQEFTTAQKAVARENLGAVNNQTPVLASKSTTTYSATVLSTDPLSDVTYLEAYDGTIHSFVYRPLNVSEIVYNNSGDHGTLYFWLAGLPNCTTLTLGNGANWSGFYVYDAENVTTLDCAGSNVGGTFAVPSGLTGLESLNFDSNSSLNGVTFTAGAHPALATLTFVGCTGFTDAAVDALLVSLEAANPSTMVGASYQGMVKGTNMTYSHYNTTNVNVMLTRTAANLAQLVVQPTLALSYLTTTDGPIGLTVTGNTNTGAITAKTVYAYPVPALIISFATNPYQTKTIGASTTFTHTGATAGKTVGLYLTQNYVGTAAVTWFNTITWAGGTVPTYANGTTTIVTLVATGADTFNGSFTTSGTLITTTTGTELIAAINGNANAATLVTASSSGTNSGAVGALSSTKLGNLTISKLVARGWTVTL